MSLFDFLTYYKILKRYYHLNRVLTMPVASQTLFLPQATFASNSSRNYRCFSTSRSLASCATCRVSSRLFWCIFYLLPEYVLRP